jgi:heme-degrading monooxygenase HmoA
MIAIIFEVQPAPGREKDYFAIAASLRDELATIDGFLSVERFGSLTTPGKYLSLSFFRDEVAVLEWRNRQAHRIAQEAGRGGIFAGYRLRVAQVLRDYGMDDRAEAPADSRAAHVSSVHPG